MNETRGIRCLTCSKLDLQQYTEHAKTGYGRCLVHEVVVFARIDMARNCSEYQAAPEKNVAARDAWYGKLQLPAWQR